MNDISVALRPLYELTKKGAVFRWTEERDKAYKEAKRKLIEATETIIPDMNKRLVLVLG
ncbi:hypothetical protein NEHOM01_2434 [Nematocida homosporus]|uniref:uncharacterized protein n=1 Tax=Nematocida homosporus TaxID=1912981 RepID=UPI0022211519|nr:uncharacterized protein NEHOM01_2434 [Nematocida homosporus]KAI5187898.1 hypothetical protein NEHOM01_2434 [Nematocida homosporus]